MLRPRANSESLRSNSRGNRALARMATDQRRRAPQPAGAARPSRSQRTGVPVPEDPATAPKSSLHPQACFAARDPWPAQFVGKAELAHGTRHIGREASARPSSFRREPESRPSTDSLSIRNSSMGALRPPMPPDWPSLPTIATVQSEWQLGTPPPGRDRTTLFSTSKTASMPGLTGGRRSPTGNG